MGESKCSTHCQAIPAASEQRLQEAPQKAALRGENERKGGSGIEEQTAISIIKHNTAIQRDSGGREEGRKEATARVACVLAYLPAPFHAPCGAPTAVSPHHAKSSTAGLGRRIPNYKYSGFE